MYIQIKDEKISLDFNPNISVSINGPDSFYYVEVREYKKMKTNRYLFLVVIFQTITHLFCQ